MITIDQAVSDVLKALTTDTSTIYRSMLPQKPEKLPALCYIPMTSTEEVDDDGNAGLAQYRVTIVTISRTQAEGSALMQSVKEVMRAQIRTGLLDYVGEDDNPGGQDALTTYWMDSCDFTLWLFQGSS